MLQSWVDTLIEIVTYNVMSLVRAPWAMLKAQIIKLVRKKFNIIILNFIKPLVDSHFRLELDYI